VDTGPNTIEGTEVAAILLLGTASARFDNSDIFIGRIQVVEKSVAILDTTTQSNHSTLLDN
jgi:hypothetical protein